jgi:alpha-tubulin suppressor-like RCC1 family protein
MKALAPLALLAASGCGLIIGAESDYHQSPPGVSPPGVPEGCGEGCGVCEPGQSDCAGNAPRQCGADGRWVEQAACDAGRGPICERGACVRATRLRSGDGHVCAGLSDGSWRCWGQNNFGQRGSEPSPSADARPAPLALDDVAELALGEAMGCALRGDQGLWCFGSNEGGRLGLGSLLEGAFPPTAVSTIGPVERVFLSKQGPRSFALLGDGSLVAWGRDGLGAGGSPSPAPVAGLPGGASVVAVAAGASHACALLGQEVSCWGEGPEGQLGNGKQACASPDACLVGGLTGVVALEAGARHTCALVAEGKVYCWGADDLGQVGDTFQNFGAPRPAPVPVGSWSLGTWYSSDSGPPPPLTQARRLAVGGEFSCALLLDDAESKIACWGDNSSGQLGAGPATINKDVTEWQPTLVRLPGGAQPVDVVAGAQHACALLDDGDVACWGNNARGAVGVAGGPGGSVGTPARVAW